MYKLTPLQKKAIDSFATSALKDNFYWTGGTLLSIFYLHHRESIDIDFFSDNPFSFNTVNSFITNFKNKEGISRIDYEKVFDRWEFLLEKGNKNLRIEFVYYNHEKKVLGARRRYMGVLIDSIEDIAANKTFAYFDRNEPKDLFDLYFLIKKAKFTPVKLLNLVRKKFGAGFTEDMFWSESFKSLNLLRTLKPLLSEKSKKEQDELFGDIGAYFKSGSSKYLNSVLTN
ncbi:hypothetical protein COX53_01905 [candidate division WWE3 bacterium CG23_combo_of_CG06-09_8_20_14_all_40_14]|uniref:Nucleotidyl transferase AbiEii/AbiGii toxin family protein n=1 Tax=candidate division WWE3 bacterium CG23_combo_of_CG06-09_8_20_14_all_40_14 TaxID=1975095 RepID=A0A2G9XC50_UNCKA|nr:MAG: hypothetical protein COX53_01905 [candidate division WWE3 bacterium CG23_combo_of_CG06-09_8_20_14_all_40_14]